MYNDNKYFLLKIILRFTCLLNYIVNSFTSLQYIKKVISSNIIE